MTLRVVPRSQFPDLTEQWAGGPAVWSHMVRDCWAGRTGAALIAWSDALFGRRLPACDQSDVTYWEHEQLQEVEA